MSDDEQDEKISDSDVKVKFKLLKTFLIEMKTGKDSLINDHAMVLLSLSYIQHVTSLTSISRIHENDFRQVSL